MATAAKPLSGRSSDAASTVAQISDEFSCPQCHTVSSWQTRLAALATGSHASWLHMHTATRRATITEAPMTPKHMNALASLADSSLCWYLCHGIPQADKQTTTSTQKATASRLAHQAVKLPQELPQASVE